MKEKFRWLCLKIVQLLNVGQGIVYLSAKVILKLESEDGEKSKWKDLF